MTALAGVWNLSGGPVAGSSVRRMLAVQKLYGPHGDAAWDGADIAIGRCMFETLPEDVYDRGPLEGGGGRFRVVADVRLDNRDELASELGIDPAEARKLPDVAFVLRAWERWEEGAFDRLYGDYAIALWDAVEHKLVLARDALGGRPLHYHQSDGFIAFASMPKGLHALPEIPYAPDPVRTAELLALLPEIGPRSFFEGISRVESGHLVTFTRNGMQARRHWDPSPEKIAPWRGGDPVEAVREHLERAVAARLRGAGTSVAAHLSGGLDSAAVASTAARLMAPGGGKVVAFTSVPREGYDGAAPKGRIGDEGELAAATAALSPNMEHVLVRPGGSGLIERLDRAFVLSERPVLNACNLEWIDSINDEARKRGLNVLLTGQMGNMTISYTGAELLPDLLAKGRWFRLLAEMRALVRTGQARWRGLAISAVGPWMPAPMWRALQRFRKSGVEELGSYSAINPAHAKRLDIWGLARSRGLDLSYRPRKQGFESRVWVLQRVDLANQRKAMLGGWGIDERDPTSDRRLVELCLSLPMTCFLANGYFRALGRRVLADRLPERVLAESRKGLQAIDWHEGLTASRDQMRVEIERLANVPAAAAALDLPRMRALIENWPEADWNESGVSIVYRHLLMRGTAGGHFLRKASRSNA